MAEIFREDFETDLSKWTLYLMEPGEAVENIIEIVCGDGRAIEGNCYCKLYCDGDVGYERCAIRTAIPEQFDIILKLPFRLSRLPEASGGFFALVSMRAYTTTTITVGDIRVTDSGMFIRYFKDGIHVDVNVPNSPLVDQQNILEVRVRIGATPNGLIEVRLNGVLIHTDSNFANDTQGGMDEMILGFYDKGDTAVPVQLDLDLTTLETPEVPPPQYNLTITVTAGGTTDPPPNVYPYDAGTMVTVTAIPETGYNFGKWLLDGVDAGTDPVTNITMDSDHTLEAVFTYEPTSTIQGVVTDAKTGQPIIGALVELEKVG